MALSNVVFEADGGLVAERNASGDRARVKLYDVTCDTSLVEPQVFQVLLEAEEFGVFCLPFVNVQCN